MRRSLPTRLIAGVVTAWALTLPGAAAAAPDYHALRLAAEAELRTKLIDPASARFQWPLGFAYGSWRPTIDPRVTGYLGCGMVNVKNRFGDDAGVRWFSVIVRDDGKVALAHIDHTVGLAQAKPYCARAGLPRPQAGMLDLAATPAQSAEMPAPSADRPLSVPAELTRLATLRDHGVLTQDEFQVLQQALLKHSP